MGGTHKEAYWRPTSERRDPTSGQLAHAAGGAGEVWMRSKARPGRVAGYATKAPLLVVPGGPGRGGAGGTQAGDSYHQALGQAEQCVWDVIVLAAIVALEMGRCFMAATLRRGPDQEEPSLVAGVELAERGARRAVMDFWGRLPRLHSAWGAEARLGVSGSSPPNSTGNRNGPEMLGTDV
jgi:hypothetical protein